MILVAGATGQVGSEVCRLLRARDEEVRALVRPSSDPGRVAALRELGVEVVEGDLRSPETLDAACSGVSAVVSTASATSRPVAGDTVLNVDGAGQLALIEAAAGAGVEHFVFVSFSGGIDVDMPLSRSKRSVERQLQDSGMSWTVLRPTAFMEVWLSPIVGFNVPAASVAVFGTGGAPVSYVSLQDVARFCVESLARPAAWNRAFELGGPEAITPLQAVRIAQEVTGTTLQVTHVPMEALRAQYEAATDPLQKSLAGLTCGLAAGDVVDMTGVVPTFGFRLRTVREFMQSAYGLSAEAPPVPGA
jgi:uncharacterized protein YbjT (DUF2867 family)